MTYHKKTDFINSYKDATKQEPLVSIRLDMLGYIRSKQGNRELQEAHLKMEASLYIVMHDRHRATLSNKNINIKDIYYEFSSSPAIDDYLRGLD